MYFTLTVMRRHICYLGVAELNEGFPTNNPSSETHRARGGAAWPLQAQHGALPRPAAPLIGLGSPHERQNYTELQIKRSTVSQLQHYNHLLITCNTNNTNSSCLRCLNSHSQPPLSDVRVVMSTVTRRPATTPVSAARRCRCHAHTCSPTDNTNMRYAPDR